MNESKSEVVSTRLLSRKKLGPYSTQQPQQKSQQLMHGSNGSSRNNFLDNAQSTPNLSLLTRKPKVPNTASKKSFPSSTGADEGEDRKTIMKTYGNEKNEEEFNADSYSRNQTLSNNSASLAGTSNSVKKKVTIDEDLDRVRYPTQKYDYRNQPTLDELKKMIREKLGSKTVFITLSDNPQKCKVGSIYDEQKKNLAIELKEQLNKNKLEKMHPDDILENMLRDKIDNSHKKIVDENEKRYYQKMSVLSSNLNKEMEKYRELKEITDKENKIPRTKEELLRQVNELTKENKDLQEMNGNYEADLKQQTEKFKDQERIFKEKIKSLEFQAKSAHTFQFNNHIEDNKRLKEDNQKIIIQNKKYKAQLEEERDRIIELNNNAESMKSIFLEELNELQTLRENILVLQQQAQEEIKIFEKQTERFIKQSVYEGQRKQKDYEQKIIQKKDQLEKQMENSAISGTMNFEQMSGSQNSLMVPEMKDQRRGSYCGKQIPNMSPLMRTNTLSDNKMRKSSNNSMNPSHFDEDISYIEEELSRSPMKEQTFGKGPSFRTTDKKQLPYSITAPNDLRLASPPRNSELNELYYLQNTMEQQMRNRNSAETLKANYNSNDSNTETKRFYHAPNSNHFYNTRMTPESMDRQSAVHKKMGNSWFAPSSNPPRSRSQSNKERIEINRGLVEAQQSLQLSQAEINDLKRLTEIENLNNRIAQIPNLQHSYAPFLNAALGSYMQMQHTPHSYEEYLRHANMNAVNAPHVRPGVPIYDSRNSQESRGSQPISAHELNFGEAEMEAESESRIEEYDSEYSEEINPHRDLNMKYRDTPPAINIIRTQTLQSNKEEQQEGDTGAAKAKVTSFEQEAYPEKEKEMNKNFEKQKQNSDLENVYEESPQTRNNNVSMNQKGNSSEKRKVFRRTKAQTQQLSNVVQNKGSYEELVIKNRADSDQFRTPTKFDEEELIAERSIHRNQIQTLQSPTNNTFIPSIQSSQKSTPSHESLEKGLQQLHLTFKQNKNI